MVRKGGFEAYCCGFFSEQHLDGGFNVNKTVGAEW